jgi:hypothetical protein
MCASFLYACGLRPPRHLSRTCFGRIAALSSPSCAMPRRLDKERARQAQQPTTQLADRGSRTPGSSTRRGLLSLQRTSVQAVRALPTGDPLREATAQAVSQMVGVVAQLQEAQCDAARRVVQTATAAVLPTALEAATRGRPDLRQLLNLVVSSNSRWGVTTQHLATHWQGTAPWRSQQVSITT